MVHKSSLKYRIDIEEEMQNALKWEIGVALYAKA